MASTPTQTSVSLKESQKKQTITKAAEAIDVAAATLSCWLSETGIEYNDASGESKLTFADAEVYVTAMKMVTLLRYRKSCIEGRPSMTQNTQLDRLHRCVHSDIRAEKDKRQQLQLAELTADEKMQIIRSSFEAEPLSALLDALFRFELRDTVTELIEEARRSNPDDSFRVVELKRLCVERLVERYYK